MAKKTTNTDSADKNPGSPEELMKLLGESKGDKAVATEAGTVYQPDLPKAAPKAPRVELTVDGFVTQVAQDVFTTTGSRDEAERADLLTRLLGNEEHVFDTSRRGDKYKCEATGLYDRVKTAASCSGMSDEAAFLRQQLWLLFEQDRADCSGDPDPGERTAQDEDPRSEVNIVISSLLGKSALGRIRSLAKQKGISNQSCLRAVVTNFLKAQKSL